MINTEPTIVDNMKHKHLCCVKCVSWTAIFIGALVAVGLSFLLDVFGVAIGLSAFTTNKEGMVTLAVGGYIGMVLSVIIAMFVAGWTTGYLGRSHCSNRNLGALYGFAMWCVAFIVTVLLVTQVNQFVSITHYSLYGTNVASVNLGLPQVAAPLYANKHADDSTYSTHVTPSTEKTTNQLGQALLLLFVLFFIGALSSCIGAYAGLRSCCCSCGNTNCTCNKKIV